MALKAVYRIRGVKKVIKGRGVGTNVAEPGDVFEPVNDKSAEKLIKGGSATERTSESQDAPNVKTGPTVVPVKEISDERREEKEPTPGMERAEETKAPAEKPLTKAQKAAAAKAAKKEAESKPAESELDDLGLDDGSDGVDE